MESESSNFFLLPNVAQEISNAQYVDMLNDHERNDFYRHSISALMAKAKAKHTHANCDSSASGDVTVLDIGTGTGLLAMMAAQAGAQKVTACEMIQSLARVAQEVVKVNNFSDIISVFNKKSNDLSVGHELAAKAHLCISEIVDSSLLGENILPSLRHAAQHLLVEDYKMIPHSAKIYGQVVESDLLWKFHTLADGCAHSSSVPYEVLFDRIPASCYTLLTEPVELFAFDFNNMASVQSQVTRLVPARSLSRGKAHAILLWWTMQLDEEGKYVLETTPFKSVWRNHWKHCLYYLPKETQIETDEFDIFACRNDYYLWFDLEFRQPNINPCFPSNTCLCKYHDLYRRSRIFQVNDAKRKEQYELAFKAAMAEVKRDNPDVEKFHVCQYGDDILLSLQLAASMGESDESIAFEHVETRSFYREITKETIEKKNLAASVSVTQELTETYHLAVAEPFYFDCQRMFPWKEAVKYWVDLWDIFNGGILSLPEAFSVRAQIVQFVDFQKQYEEVRVEGIDLTVFDRVLSIATPITMHSLWMYEWSALSEPFDLMKVNIATDSPYVDYQNQINIDISQSGTVHAVVIWIDYHLNEHSVVSNQPLPGDAVPNWARQAVWMFKEYERVEASHAVHADAKYDANDSDFSFNFVL